MNPPRPDRALSLPWITAFGLLLPALLAPALPAAGEDSAAGLPFSLSADYAGTAHSAALSSANLASVRNTESVYANPAGLGFALYPEVSLLYVNLHENTVYDFLGGLYPLQDLGTFGLGWARLSSRGFTLRDAADTQLGSFDDLQNTVWLSYGRLLADAFGLGGSLKFNFHDIHRTHTAELSLDLALRYQPFPSLAAALVLQNAAYAPLTSGGASQPVPLLGRLGLAWTPDLKPLGLNSLTLFAAADCADGWNQRLGFQTPGWAFKLGLEYEVIAGIRLQAGLQNERQTLGASVPYFPFTFHYAFDLRPAGSLHWLSVGYYFGSLIDPVQIKDLPREALAAAEQKDFPRSISLLNQTHQTAPDNHLARVYAQDAGRRQRAEAAPLLEAARAANRAQDLDQAETLARRVLALDPNHAGAAKLLAEIEHQRQAAAQARREAEAARLRAEAEALYQGSRWMEAVRVWEQSQELNPGNTETAARIEQARSAMAGGVDAYFARGVALLEKKDYAAASEHFHFVLKIVPSHLLARYYLEKTKTEQDLHFQRLYPAAIGQLRRMNYQAALGAFRQIAAWDPAYKKTADYIALVEAKLASLEAALAAYGQALRAYQARDLDQAEQLLAPMRGRPDQLTSDIVALDAKIRGDQAACGRLLQTGLAAYQRGEFPAAAAALRQGLALNARGEVRNTLAQVYTSQGILAYRRDQLAEAVRAWENALALGPDPSVQRYLDRARKKQRFLKETLHEN